MIVSIIIPSFYPAIVYGGTIFSSLNSARIFTALGHSVYVSTTNTNKSGRLDVSTGNYMEMEKNLFVKYYNETIVDKVSFPLLFHIRKDIANANLVYVQAIFNTPIPVALLFSRLKKKPVLLAPHGVLGEWVMNQGSSFKKAWLNLFIKPHAKYVYWHATSEQEKQEILSHFPEARIVIIPNPINLEEYSKSTRLTKTAFLNKFVNLSGNPEKILVSMGRLQKKKGFDILIKAFKKVQKEFPEAYLFIAGQDEGEKIPLAKLIDAMGLGERVFFTGNLEGQDKVDFLANADLFILPSHNENFGIVYAEALASGTPVIASTETPWQEVEKFNCGRWVNNTVEANENAMIEMLTKNDPTMRSNAKEYAKRFSFENVAKDFTSFFNVIARQNA